MMFGRRAGKEERRQNFSKNGDVAYSACECIRSECEEDGHIPRG